MEQKNIDIMNKVVDKLANGEKFSHILAEFYDKRKFAIPVSEKMLKTPIRKIGFNNRTYNSLMQNGYRTLNDIVNFCAENGNKFNVDKIGKMGPLSAQTMFESIVDYCYDQMEGAEKVNFLIDCIERNTIYIKI